MKTPKIIPLAKNAILALAEIKTAVETFDRGETNALDALDAIAVAVEAHLMAAKPKRKTA